MAKADVTKGNELAGLWRVGTLDCSTLRITYQHLDNPQLTVSEALSIVSQWGVSEAGRRLSWLVGRMPCKA